MPTNESKEKIRPIYKELQGYLSQIPQPKDSDDFVTNPKIWEQFNQAIEELNEQSGKNYDKFKASPSYSEEDYQEVSLTDYRQKIGGLISRLHAEYFSDEPEPFSGTPSTIITQSQQQAQTQQIQMLLDFKSLIDKKLPEFKEKSKEKKFLEKIKSSLPTIKNAIELIKLILSVAGGLGLTIEELSKILRYP